MEAGFKSEAVEENLCSFCFSCPKFKLVLKRMPMLCICIRLALSEKCFCLKVQTKYINPGNRTVNQNIWKQRPLSGFSLTQGAELEIDFLFYFSQ